MGVGNVFEQASGESALELEGGGPNGGSPDVRSLGASPKTEVKDHHPHRDAEREAGDGARDYKGRDREPEHTQHKERHRDADQVGSIPGTHGVTLTGASPSPRFAPKSGANGRLDRYISRLPSYYRNLGLDAAASPAVAGSSNR